MSLDLFATLYPEFEKKIIEAGCKAGPYKEGTDDEAHAWAASLKIDQVDTLYLYGLDHGHYIHALQPWFQEKRLLIVFEDDPSLFHLFLTWKGAKDLLLNPQILFVLYQTEGDLEKAVEASLNTKSFFTSLKPYNNEAAALLKQSLELRKDELLYNLAFMNEETFDQGLNNIYHNLLRLPEMLRADSFFGRFSKFPAIICGAGPSIEKQLPQLKTLTDRALFFGAGTGMNILNAHGIFAHFGCGVDPNIESRSRILTNKAYATPYFTLLQFNDEAYKLLHAPRIFFRGTESYPVSSWLLSQLHLNDMKEVEFTSSTTGACIALAKALGCHPIILVGVDLCYSNDRHYPEVVQPHPSEIKGKKKKALGMVSAISTSQKNFLTRPDWLNEAAAYGTFSAKNPGLLINATLDGLEIPKTPHMSLETVENFYLGRSYDIVDAVNKVIAEAETIPVTYEEAKCSLQNWKSILEKDIAAIRNGGEAEAYSYFFEQIEKTFNSYARREKILYRFSEDHLATLEVLKKALNIGIAEKQIKKLNEILEEKKPVSRQKPTTPLILQGKISLYNMEGKLTREIPYEKGKIHGVERLWDDEGNLLYEASYEQGIPKGKTTVWKGNSKKEYFYYDWPEGYDESHWVEGQLTYQNHKRTLKLKTILKELRSH